MATHGGDYHRGDMNIDEHERTYSGFMKVSKWASLYVAALLLLITLWFCTTAGFIGAVFCSAVLVALGTLVLGEKSTH